MKWGTHQFHFHSLLNLCEGFTRHASIQQQEHKQHKKKAEQKWQHYFFKDRKRAETGWQNTPRNWCEKLLL